MRIKVFLRIKKLRELRQKLLQVKTPVDRISEICKVSYKTVNRLKKRRPQRKKGSGRRKFLNRSSKLSIRNSIDNNPFLNSQDLVNRLSLDCSAQTVRRYLAAAGYHYQLMEGKEPLSEQHMTTRLEWCEEWGNFQNFDKLIFMDETGIYLGDTKGKGWIKSGTYFNPTETELTEKLNVWRAISSAGKVAIHIYRKNLDRWVYQGILEDTLVPHAEEMFPDGCYLQHGNHPLHKASIVTNFLNPPRQLLYRK